MNAFTALKLTIAAALLVLAPGCSSTSPTTYTRRVVFTFQVDRIVWPYPILRDVPISPGANFTEKQLGAVSLVVLGKVTGGVTAAPPPGYWMVLASDLPADKLKLVVGETYEAEIFENFVPAMYVPAAPGNGWDQEITDIRELIALKKK